MVKGSCATSLNAGCKPLRSILLDLCRCTVCASCYCADVSCCTVLQVQEQLLRERENYSALHDQHMQLRRQQEVLAAELMVALGSYKPKANIDAGAPAAAEALRGLLVTSPAL